MKRYAKLSTFLGTATIVAGGLVAILPITSCSSSNSEPTPPIVENLKIDGSNWSGHTSGILNFTKYDATHTVTYTGNNDYVANDLVIPDVVMTLMERNIP